MKLSFKRLLAVTLAGMMMLGVMTACSEESVSTENESENVLEFIEEEGKNNAGKDPGTYETPNESEFGWESTEGGVVITDYTGSATAIRIPDTINGEPVVAIDRGISAAAAFTGIILPDSVTELREEAFSFCTALVEVQFGSGLKTIGDSAFLGCSALTEITFNEGLETIGYNAFSTCSSLKKIHISSTVQFIDSGAFAMSGLENVTIPGNVKALGEMVFSYCDSLKSVTLEEGVETIGDDTFAYCTSLLTVSLPSSLNEIGSNVIWDSPNAKLKVKDGSAAHTYAVENETAHETV